MLVESRHLVRIPFSHYNWRITTASGWIYWISPLTQQKRSDCKLLHKKRNESDDHDEHDIAELAQHHLTGRNWTSESIIEKEMFGRQPCFKERFGVKRICFELFSVSHQSKLGCSSRWNTLNCTDRLALRQAGVTTYSVWPEFPFGSC